MLLYTYRAKMPVNLTRPAYAITISITEKRIPNTMQSPLIITPNIDRAAKTTPDALEILAYVFLFILRNPLSDSGNGFDAGIGFDAGNGFDAGKRADESAD